MESSGIRISLINGQISSAGNGINPLVKGMGCICHIVVFSGHRGTVRIDNHAGLMSVIHFTGITYGKYIILDCHAAASRFERILCSPGIIGIRFAVIAV